MTNTNEISEVSERKIFDGYSDGTFYSLGTFLGFMGKLGARKIIHLFPKSYGGIEGGDEVWMTPEGIGVRYTYERGPEKITLPDPHAERTRWPGKAKVLAFGLEAKLDSFEAQVKQEAEKFAYEKMMIKRYNLNSARGM